MQVQHPNRRQYDVAPQGHPEFTTDETGVSPDLPDPVAKQLIAQGWTPVTPKSTKAAPAAPSDEER